MNVEMESKKISWKVAISILLAVLTVFITYFCIVVFSIWPIDEVSIQNIGMLGDSFGLLTSLFSGLALGAAIYLLYVQKSEFNNIRRHSLMMARIERANFQPRFDVSGKYTTLGVAKNENTITITSKHAGDHERFFIFKQVEIIFDNKTYTKDDATSRYRANCSTGMACMRARCRGAIRLARRGPAIRHGLTACGCQR